MSTRLSKEERINKYRAAIRFPSLDAMLDALGFRDEYDYTIAESGYSQGERICSILKNGFELVKYNQNYSGECVIYQLYRVAPQFFYDVTPRNPYFDEDTGKWVAGPDPEVRFIKSITNRYQLLDMKYSIYHAFPASMDSKPGEVFDVLKRTREGIERFKYALPTMILWLSLPKNTKSRDWHKVRRSRWKGGIVSVLQHIHDMFTSIIMQKKG